MGGFIFNTKTNLNFQGDQEKTQISICSSLFSPLVFYHTVQWRVLIETGWSWYSLYRLIEKKMLISGQKAH